MLMLFYFIRHGDPIYDPDSLTPLGKRQAEAIGRRLAQTGIDALYVSSSNRAVQTAAPLSEMLHLPMNVLDWCSESHAWEEFTFSALPDGSDRRWVFDHPATRPAMATDEVRGLGSRWYTHPIFAKTGCTGGVARIAAASDAFFAQLGYVHDPEKHAYLPVQYHERRIALFAHAGFGMAFLSYMLDIPYPLMCSFSYTHTGMTVIDFHPENGVVYPTVLQYCGDGHLYREGLPTRYNNGPII